MSQAFVKENDDNGLLHQVEPNLPALLKYLQVENNGRSVFVKSTDKKNDVDIIAMSNGFSYFINKNREWEMEL